MKAEFDSEADALQIDLVATRPVGYDADVVDGICTVGISNGRAVGVELLSPEIHLPALKAAAERYDLDPVSLEAAARAALAAPDRVVTLDLSPQREPQT